MAMVLHHSRAKGTAKLVLLGIANHQGDGGAWPSVATLARYAGVDARSVQRALAQLQATGEVVVKLQQGGTPGMEDYDRPNLYQVNVSCPPWCDRTPQHRDTRPGQSPLWKTRVTPVSPGDARVTPPGDARVTPRVTPVSPKPAPNQPLKVTESQPHPQTAGAWCAVCGLNHPGRRHADGHPFTERTA
jgi:hypothetical protein